MKNITLVAIEFQTYELTRYAIERTLDQIDVKEVLVIADKEIVPGARHVIRDPVKNMAEYAEVMLKGVAEHVESGHALYIHWDGMAHDKNQWTDDFLKYDYIGAIWPGKPEGQNVGNGGFSLRSKRMLDACMDPRICLTPAEPVAEDNIMSNHRPYLETEYGVEFAPTELARQFSFELGVYKPSFGFHGLWNMFTFMSDADMEFWMNNIKYKGWNIYKWHHTLYAVMRTGRMDIYEYMLNQLIANSPELLEPVAQWLERDAKTLSTEFVVM